ncbi:MAG: hypothetical protein Q8O39_01275 [bacterium]|nr:hypothetical protein [bacterium]
MQFFKSPITGFVLGTTISICLLSVSILFAWTEPTLNPPQGNISGPINISNTGQSKAGGLILNTGGAAVGLVVDKGNVGIGTANPKNKLEVTGIGNVVFNTSGNVGIGVMSPGYKLHVSDAIHASGDIKTDKDVCTNLGCLNELIAIVNPWLVNGIHRASQCSAIGGNVVYVSPGMAVCQYPSSSCPSGWRSYLNWSTTQSVPYYFHDSRRGPWWTCPGVAGHVWSNNAVECEPTTPSDPPRCGRCCPIVQIGCY